MTRKDCELIAYAAKLAKPGESERALATPERWEAYCQQWADTVDCIADALAGDNPRFDRDRFLRACGVES